MILNIKKQPAPNYHYRYIGDPRCVLTGCQTKQEKSDNIINYPQVNITLTKEESTTAKRVFYILASIHKYANKCLSPHLLMRRGEMNPDYSFIFEQMTPISPLEYSWELRDYFIVRSKQGEYRDIFLEKKKAYEQLQLPLEFETLKGDVDIENAQSRKQSGDLIVSLGFTIFEKVSNNGAATYRLCQQTQFSNPIYNGDDLCIKRICNKKGYKNEFTEITLLIVFNSNYPINVIMKRADGIEWTKVITITNDPKDPNEMFHNAAITFQAPPYDGPSSSDGEIITLIHVEVANTLYRSNDVKFCYINDDDDRKEPERKRPCIENAKNVASNMNDNEISCIPETSSNQNRHLNLLTNEDEINLVLDNNLNFDFINDNSSQWSPYFTENSEFNFDALFERFQDVVPQIPNYIEDDIPDENISRDSATLNIHENVPNEKMRNLNVKSRMEQNSEPIQNYNFEDKPNTTMETTQEVAAGNISSKCMIQHKKSIKIMDINSRDCNILFHQVLLNDNTLQRFYKGFEDIQYKPLLRQARNDKRENLLHYACIYNKAFCIRPLIGLGIRINEQDIFGRTPLHIALEFQYTECVIKIQELLENHTNYPKEVKENFIKMFKVYNHKGYTVLHSAILENRLELVEIMLKFCREHQINIFDFEVLGNGDSVVHLAVKHNLIDMVKILNCHWTSNDYRTVTNYSGQSAMELTNISDEMMSLLS